MSSPARSSGEFRSAGEWGSPAEIVAPDSRAQRLVIRVNTRSLSFDSGLESDGALSGSGRL